jgi:hypothetical protein
MALISPGVQVSVIDQSNYTPAAASSVPFILLATAQNKISGAGTGIAPGTLAANANKLYLDKVLLIKGSVGSFSKTQAGENTITLSSADPFSGVMASLDTTVSKILNIGDTIEIKGFCKGYLSDVVITNAIIK